jgi:hypothetical protein
MYTQTEGSLVPCPVGGPGCRESVDLDLVARCCPAREDAPANIGQQALQHFQLEAVKLAAEAQLVQRQLAKACDDLQDAKGVLSEEDRVTATACRGVRKALSLATLVVCPACGGSAPLCAADLPQHCMAMHCTSKGCRLSGAAGYCFLCRKEFPAPTRGAMQTQDSLHSHVSQCERHPYKCVTWLGRGEVTPLPCVPTLQALASKASLRSACSPPTHRLGGGGQRSRLREPQYFLDVQDWDSLVAIMMMHAVKAVEEVLHDLKDSQLDQLRSTAARRHGPAPRHRSTMFFAQYRISHKRSALVWTAWFKEGDGAIDFPSSSAPEAHACFDLALARTKERLGEAGGPRGEARRSPQLEDLPRQFTRDYQEPTRGTHGVVRPAAWLVGAALAEAYGVEMPLSWDNIERALHQNPHQAFEVAFKEFRDLQHPLGLSHFTAEQVLQLLHADNFVVRAAVDRAWDMLERAWDMLEREREA